MAWSVALSFAVVPIAAELIGKFGGARSLALLCWVAIVTGVVAILINTWRLRRPVRSVSKAHLFPLVLGVVWVIFVIGELVDVGVGNHLYMSVTVFDHALRTAFVDAVMRTGVPPANPLYSPGHAVPLRYYYFWYVVTALAAKLGGVTARQAMIASVVWAGLGLAAMLALYSRYFLGERSAGNRTLWPRVAIALGLLAVTGLDILPALVKFLAHMPTDADMEWWSSDQVTSWMASLLWVPHHVAGLVCCLLGFLLVWMSRGRERAQRWICAGIAGAAFASAFGLSTWVAVAFAMAMVLWGLWVLVLERGSRGRLPVLLGAGAIAVVLLVPYLIELNSETSAADTAAQVDANSSVTNRGSSQLLRFGVRHVIEADVLLGVPGFTALQSKHPQVEDALAGMLLLLPGYFVELGFYGLVLVVAMRARGLDEACRTALALTVAAMLVATFLRSSLVANDDFGIRSILIAQFFLLLLAVCWYEGGLGDSLGRSRGLPRAMLAMLWIGVAGTVYQAGLLRVYLPLEDGLGREQLGGLAEQAMALRRGLAMMDGHVPMDAVLQFNTDQPNDYLSDVQIMLAGRQLANALHGCATPFGGEREKCQAIQGSVARLFPGQGMGMTAGEAQVECSRLGVNGLVATRWDAVWSDRKGWVWGLPVVVATPDARVVRCGTERK
jgi:hypothetical protein